MLGKKYFSKIKQFAARQKDVLAVYLYGSQAGRQARPDSDIDLAILFDEEKKLPSSWGGRHVSISGQLSQLLKKEVEVQDLSLADVSFCHRVLTEGRLVYCKNDNKRADFEVGCLNSYFDLKPFYQEYYSVLQQKARKGVI
jgi:uncharacterized protein